MIAARRQRSAGSRLHLRLTGVFALLALIPTVTVADLLGADHQHRPRRLVLGPGAQRRGHVAAAPPQAYEEEHRQELARDAPGAGRPARTRERRANFFMADGEVRQLARPAAAADRARADRGLRRRRRRPRSRSAAPRSYEFDFERPSAPRPSPRPRTTGIAIIEDWDNNEFRALMPLVGLRRPIPLRHARGRRRDPVAAGRHAGDRRALRTARRRPDAAAVRVRAALPRLRRDPDPRRDLAGPVVRRAAVAPRRAARQRQPAGRRTATSTCG